MSLFEDFIKWNPILVREMENCSHHFNLRNPNPYHLEGSVLNHTCMVYNNIYDSHIHKLFAICHDIGKVYTRYIDGDRVRMSGHELAGIQDTIDFLFYLGCDYPTIYCELLTLISNHMNFISDQMKEKDKIKLCNNNQSFIELAEDCSIADKRGSITSDKDMKSGSTSIDTEQISDSDEPIFDVSHCNIILMCGIPGSGKDYIASRRFPDAKIVSWDNIRIRLYKDYLKERNMGFPSSEAELYNQAFNFVNKNKINLNSYLKEEVESVLKSGYNQVIVSNTNLTRKRRRSTINLLSKLADKIGAMYVVADYNTALRRNTERKSKQISESTICKMSLNQQMPTLFDGFDDIEFVLN